MNFKNLLLTFSLLLIAIFAFSQGQNDAPIYQNITTPQCHDDGNGNLTSFTTFQIIRVGDDNPCITKNLLPDGTTYTPPGTGTITQGYCVPPISTPDCEIVNYCDGTTAFFRIFYILKAPDGTQTISTSDITEAGAIYTATGNEVRGECNSVLEGEAVVTPSTSTTTGTFAAGDFVKVKIVNCGCANGTYTIGASTVSLFVGSSFEYEAYFNPLTNEYELNPAITFDATGTEFCIVTTGN